jgi:signal transduction histidine kinase
MVRGRLTGFALDAAGQAAIRPVRDFRGWLWQDGRCLSARTQDPAADSCARRSFFSIRLPIDMWRDAIYSAKTSGDKAGLAWPPADLDRIAVQLQLLPPRDGAPLFDSRTPGATPPFALADLKRQLQAGETLRIRRLASAESPAAELAVLGADSLAPPEAPHWLSRLIARLPAGDDDGNSTARETVETSLARYEIEMTGDGRSVNRTLEAVATRVSWFVAAMLLAILLAWLAIEMRIIRRITLLSRRAAEVSHTVRGTDDALPLDLSDLKSSDELGVLADALAGLLQRVNEDARRERIRTAQEKDQWHAVGHEIMSPLQSLKALHAAPDDPSARYIHRMQQAVRVLYGSASPSEAFAATTLSSAVLDVDQFLQQIAANAPAAGIANVRYAPHAGPVLVKADEHALEDALAHVLRNADRYRTAGSAILLTLDARDGVAELSIFNDGPPISDGMLEKIFEYGVSDQADSAALGNRGQGLFVARTYLAKMGGTIAARNAEGGAAFVLTLQRA